MVKVGARMPPSSHTRPHRQPLLIGILAYRRLAIVPDTLLIFSGTAASIAFIWGDLPLPDLWYLVGTLAGALGAALSIVLLISPLGIAFALSNFWGSFRRAIGSRACDVVISADEFEIVGGPAHGFRAPLIDMATGIETSDTGVSFRRHDGHSVALPFPADPEERASLDALIDVLRASAAARLHGGPVRREPPNLLRCRECGAPQTPAASEAIHCPFCGATNPVPPEMAEKIRAALSFQRQRKRDEALIRALMRQPGARVANLIAFSAGLGMWLLALAAVALSAITFDTGFDLGVKRLGWLSPIVMGIGLLLIAFVDWALARRRALRTLTLGFASAPPEREGGPARCRQCGGGLPEPGRGDWLSQCVYCNTDNLHVVDLSVEADILSRFSQDESSPTAILGDTRRARRRVSSRVAWSGLLIAIGLLWLQSNPTMPRASSAIPVVPHETAPATPRERGASVRALGGYRFVEVARIPGHIEALLPGRDGGIAAVVRVEKSRRLVESPRGTMTIEQFEASPELRRASSYARSSADTPLLTAEDGGHVLCRHPDGSQQTVYGEGIFDDTWARYVTAAGAPCSGYATTRATFSGHWNLRKIGPSGSRRIRSDARHAAVSPDGEQVVASFLTEKSRRFQLVVFPEGEPSEARWLTEGDGHLAFPTWSPDGRKIAFLTQPTTTRKFRQGLLPIIPSDTESLISSSRSGRVRLFVIDLDGNLEQITDHGDLQSLPPVWTEEGLHFVVSRVSLIDGRPSTPTSYISRLIPPPSD